MKYTNKWIVVPYNTLLSKSKENTPTNIFLNKSLTDNDKIAAYNYYVKKNIQKEQLKKIKPETENTKNETMERSDTDEDDELSKLEDTIKDETFLTPIKPEKREKSQNTPISEIIKKIKDLSKSPTTLQKELFGSPEFDDSFKNLSMFNEPPADNTRQSRNIDNDLYKKVLEKNHNKKKKNKKQEEKIAYKKKRHDQNRGLTDSTKKKSETSVLQDSVSWDPQFDLVYNKKRKK
jgi:hypothetical protein